MKVRVEDDADDDEDLLCDCKFTLAYGAMVLLKNTTMKLARGKKYGLLGQNDCGKTTLLRAIAGDPGVDGFPPREEVRTVFVQADILGELSHLLCIEYVMEDPAIKEAVEEGAICEADVVKVMVNVGFTDGDGATGGKYARVRDPVSTLSGGWRMKLALARAMLQKADVLLMDEPTNHLDVRNVNWVKEYLNGLKDVTCIIVSHNADLLQSCCQGMLHIKDMQLKLHKCDLSTFVEQHPEAKSFFELKAQSSLEFKFPKPSNIDGVNSRGKALMKMDCVEWTYPGNPKPTVTGLTVRVSMASRVACVGPNGAGKSTMIKLLTGELEPKIGNVWKHPNAKIAYVAQHAFHHIERHMQRTPVEYILWRYEHGADKEGLEKSSMIMTEEEEKKLHQKKMWEYTDNDGQLAKTKQTIAELTGNRKDVRGGKSYEVRFEGMPREVTFWIRQDGLEDGGWSKMLREVDEKILAREAMYKRPLTQKNVVEHFDGLGLDQEFAAHHQIRALSNGQRVKVVLAACMWNQPHLVILDEPTNYLDRESLGALAQAIKTYEGGVVLISHNNQFCSELCPETWVLERGEDGVGRCDCQGDAAWMENAAREKVEQIHHDVMIDAFGNEKKVREKKKLTRKERIQREKAKKQALELGEPWSSDEEY
jgi:elongation factor 3